MTKVLEFQHRSFQINIQGWFPLGLTGLISLQYKGLSRVFFSTTVQKHQFFVPTQGCPLCYLGFPGGSAAKESDCNAGDLASIPRLGRSPEEGNSNPLQYPFFFPPLQYSCLENLLGRGAWRATVHRVVKSLTQLSNFHFTSNGSMLLIEIFFKISMHWPGCWGTVRSEWIVFYLEELRV